MDASGLYQSLSDENKLILIRLSEEIIKGRVILFLGASANYHSPHGFETVYSPDDRPAISSELIEKLIDTLIPPGRFPEKNSAMKNEHLSLSYTAQIFEETNKRNSLIEKLGEFIDDKKPSPILKALAEMNFKFIVSTNYDNLFEEALKGVGKAGFYKGVYQANKRGIPKATYMPDGEISFEKPFLFKLHGDIKTALVNKNWSIEGDSIVITDEDYLQFILRMSQVNANKEKTKKGQNLNFYPIPEAINDAFTGKNQNTFLFIGYGLQDYNLRLIFKTALWQKDNNIFQELQKWSITTDKHDAILEFFKSKYQFTFIKDDLWCAIPYLYKIMFDKEMPL